MRSGSGARPAARLKFATTCSRRSMETSRGWLAIGILMTVPPRTPRRASITEPCRGTPKSWPAAQEFVMPALLTGKVVDADGRPLRNADVVLLQNGVEVMKTRSSIPGEYRLTVLKPSNQTYDLRVTKDHLGNTTNGLSLAGGGGKTLDFPLYEAPSVFGSIIGAEQRPPSLAVPMEGRRAGVKVQLE